MNKTIWLAAFLIFSISLNLLSLGIVIGRHVSDRPPERDHFQWMMHETSNETRKRIKASTRHHMEATREQRRELRSLQRSVLEVISAEPYNEQSVSRELEKLRQLSAELQTSMHQQMLKNLRKMTPEERSFAFRLLIHGERRPRPPRHGG